MPDLHLRVIRQFARLRRGEPPAVRDRKAGEPGADRARHAEDVQSRADAQSAAASAKRDLDDPRRS